MAKRVSVITGSRSEYGILLPVLKEIQARPESELTLIVTGAHLSPRYGHTIDEIVGDGFHVVTTPNVIDRCDDSNAGMALASGRYVLEVTKVLTHITPEMLVLLGDRVEIFAAAIAATYLNIPIAHIHGGDRTNGGHIDDSVRHAISKLAHLHFAASAESEDRLLKLGEERWRVHKVGSPALDTILNAGVPTKDERNELFSRFGLDPARPCILVLYHPITTETRESVDQFEEILAAIEELKEQTIVLYPNADAGSRRLIGMIEKRSKLSGLLALKNVEHKLFTRLMQVCDVLVGNSSAGIIEAASCGLAAVNVGKRQEARERGANVVDVPPNRQLIAEAIIKALGDEDFRRLVSCCSNPYGDGQASRRIADVLVGITIDKKLLQKQMTY